MKIRMMLLVALATVLAGACRSPALSSEAATQDLKLRFLISGQSASGSSAAKLLLANMKSLSVEITQASTAGTVVIATKSLSLDSGASEANVVFPALETGTYTVSALVYDADNTLRFQQSTALTITVAGSETVSLNLVPVDPGLLDTLALNVPAADTLAVGESISWVVPNSAMTSSQFRLSLSGGTDSAVQCYIQDQNGAALSTAPLARDFPVAVSGTDYAFVTLYNPDTTPLAYSLEVLAPTTVDGTWSTSSPTTYSLAFTAQPSTVYFGNPASFSVSYTGSSAAYTWYIDGTAVSSGLVSSTAAASTLTLLPTTTALTYGAHTVTAVARDATSGLDTNINAKVTAANNVPGTSGLVGEWLLAGNADDTSGYARNGVLGSGVSATADRHGNAGMACAFAGDTIAIDDSYIRFAYNHAFSVSVWFKADSIPGSGWANILSEPGSGGQFQYFVNLDSAGTLYATVGQNNNGSGQFSVTAASLSTEDWHHIVMAYSGTTMTFYLDGVSLGSAVYSLSAIDPPDSSLNFGGSEFTGAISSVRIYDYQLSAAQVAALANE